MRFKEHPRGHNYCVFCEYWTGDAQMKFVNTGYEYENTARGYCPKRNLSMIAIGSCREYEPSREAKRLL